MYCFKSNDFNAIVFTINDLETLQNKFNNYECITADSISDALNFLDLITGNIYAIKEGKVRGIFFSWDACKDQIDEYPNCAFKSFRFIKDAFSYLNYKGFTVTEKIPEPQADDFETEILGANLQEKINDVTNESKAFAYVDGSYNADTCTYGYGVLLVYNGNEYEFSGADNEPEMATMRNVSGEILGATRAITEAKALGIKELVIYYDYQGIAAWPDETWRRNKKYTIQYHDFVVNERKNMKIDFVKVKAHSGVKYNEKVDKIAKKIVGI
jgi:ribonuclease HI